MELMQLQEIYETYVKTLANVYRNAKPADGLFGWGDDPKKDPCHMQFYEQTEQWIQDLLASQPEQELVFETVRFVVTYPSQHRGEHCFWFAYAAHGLIKDLIPLLTTAQCGELWAFYEENYPRRDRMPVQKEICKLLKKGSGRRF